MLEKLDRNFINELIKHLVSLGDEVKSPDDWIKSKSLSEGYLAKLSSITDPMIGFEDLFQRIGDSDSYKVREETVLKDVLTKATLRIEPVIEPTIIEVKIKEVVGKYTELLKKLHRQGGEITEESKKANLVAAFNEIIFSEIRSGDEKSAEKARVYVEGMIISDNFSRELNQELPDKLQNALLSNLKDKLSYLDPSVKISELVDLAKASHGIGKVLSETVTVENYIINEIMQKIKLLYLMDPEKDNINERASKLEEIRGLVAEAVKQQVNAIGEKVKAQSRENSDRPGEVIRFFDKEARSVMSQYLITDEICESYYSTYKEKTKIEYDIDIVTDNIAKAMGLKNTEEHSKIRAEDGFSEDSGYNGVDDIPPTTAKEPVSAGDSAEVDLKSMILPIYQRMIHNPFIRGYIKKFMPEVEELYKERLIPLKTTQALFLKELEEVVKKKDPELNIIKNIMVMDALIYDYDQQPNSILHDKSVPLDGKIEELIKITEFNQAGFDDKILVNRGRFDSATGNYGAPQVFNAEYGYGAGLHKRPKQMLTSRPIPLEELYNTFYGSDKPFLTPIEKTSLVINLQEMADHQLTDCEPKLYTSIINVLEKNAEQIFTDALEVAGSAKSNNRKLADSKKPEFTQSIDQQVANIIQDQKELLIKAAKEAKAAKIVGEVTEILKQKFGPKLADEILKRKSKVLSTGTQVECKTQIYHGVLDLLSPDNMNLVIAKEVAADICNFENIQQFKQYKDTPDLRRSEQMLSNLASVTIKEKISSPSPTAILNILMKDVKNELSET